MPGTFARKNDARDAAIDFESKAKRKAAVATGTLSAKITWAQWVDIWWPTRDLGIASEASEAKCRDRTLIPEWGDTPLNGITRAAVQRWVNRLSKKHSANYVHRIYATFRASINAAVLEDVLQGSPLTAITLPRITSSEQRIYDDDEFAALLAEMKPRYRDVCEFLRETGLRPGELAGLHRDRISRSTQWLTVADVLLPEQKKIKTIPKDDEPRYVPLTSKAIEILDRWEAEIPLRNGCGLEHTDGKPCTSDLALRMTNGNPQALNSFREVFTGACRRAKIRLGSPYDIRHCFASRLAEAGVDAFEIARLMGHSSVKQSQTYIHRTAAARDRVLAALGDPKAGKLRAVGRKRPRGTGRGTDRRNQAVPATPKQASGKGA